MAMLNDQMVIAIIIYQTGPSIFPKRIVIVFWPSSMATLSKEWQWTTCPELCSIWVKFEVQGMPCRAMVIIKIVGSVVFFKIHNRNFRSRLEKPFYIPHRLAFVKFILDVGEHWEKWTQIAQVILSIACGQMPATIPAFQGIIVSSVHPNKSLTIHLQMKETSHLAAFATGYIYIYI